MAIFAIPPGLRSVRLKLADSRIAFVPCPGSPGNAPTESGEEACGASQSLWTLRSRVERTFTLGKRGFKSATGLFPEERNPGLERRAKLIQCAIGGAPSKELVMWKTVLAVTTALVIAGGSLAVAESMPPADTPPADTLPREQPSVQDTNARVDTRLARIKQRLRLTSEQEQHWPAVETAVRDIAKQRAARVSERRSSRDRPDVIERMRRSSDDLAARAAAMKQFADASEPLYKSLDNRQRRQFVALLGNAAAVAQETRRAVRRARARNWHRYERRWFWRGYRSYYWGRRVF
jgi:hypothetical protein